jgi:preprotein translocase subunit SecF
MYDIVGRRAIWFVISAVLTVPAIIFMIWSLVTYGTILPLNIDYEGGTVWEMRFASAVQPAEVRQVFVENDFPETTVYLVEDDQTVQAKLETLEPEAKAMLAGALAARFGEYEERQYRSIGPSIGAEVSRAALGAVVIASVGILLYIAWAFRTVSHPFRYGTCAIIALVHDVLVTITFIGVMHWIAGWEVDALFLTAILTVIGFSVHDTIVVFDRIRENLKRHRAEDFATVTNRSLWETMPRSLATQITVNLVLVALLVFGGASLRQFMATMLVGMLCGTYSSIFNSAPLLVAWEERSWLGSRRKKNGALADSSPAVAT